MRKILRGYVKKNKLLSLWILFCGYILRTFSADFFADICRFHASVNFEGYSSDKIGPQVGPRKGFPGLVLGYFVQGYFFKKIKTNFFFLFFVVFEYPYHHLQQQYPILTYN